nr:MAG TPA: hypothetical protein [Caudoviricetes sp.]
MLLKDAGMYCILNFFLLVSYAAVTRSQLLLLHP